MTYGCGIGGANSTFCWLFIWLSLSSCFCDGELKSVAGRTRMDPPWPFFGAELCWSLKTNQQLFRSVFFWIRQHWTFSNITFLVHAPLWVSVFFFARRANGRPYFSHLPNRQVIKQNKTKQNKSKNNQTSNNRHFYLKVGHRGETFSYRHKILKLTESS